jgi:hypothetical protein
MPKIDFSFTTKHGVFSDALNLPDDQVYTDAEIEAMKQQRLTNWLAVVENPPEVIDVPVDPQV